MASVAAAQIGDYGPPEDPRGLTERSAARVLAHRLAIELEEGSDMPVAAIEQFIRDAEQRGWPEVVRSGLYLAWVRSKRDGKQAQEAALERLLERAEADGDPVMTAMALAKRSR